MNSIELNENAKKLFDSGDYENSEIAASQALSIAQELTDKSQEGVAINNLGHIARMRGDYLLAESLFLQAIEIYQGLGRKDGIASNLSNCGILYYYKSDYPKALEYYQMALSINEELIINDGIAVNLGNIGLVYGKLGLYDKALENYQKALKLYEELNAKEGIARNLSNIGNVYHNLLDYGKALEYYNRSFSQFESLGNKYGVAHTLGNIGLIYMEEENYDLALEYYQRALAFSKELSNKTGIAFNLSSIGNIYGKLSEFETELEYYKMALAINEELGRKDSVARNLGNIGVTYADVKYNGYNSETAEEYMLKAIAICEEISDKHHLYELHRDLASLYKIEKRWIDFSVHFEQYHDLEKEVQSEEAKHQAEQMEYRRKIEESERDRQVKLARFQEQEKILHNILPSQIADRMIDGEKTIADSHENVSVFFSDIVGFTKLSQRVSAEELVGMLNGIFSQFDQLARKHGLEKIKTIGDAYMAVCGAPIHVDNHAERAAFFALDVAELMNNYKTNIGDKVMIRIGLHSGSVVAGIIGENKFAYDMWGDAVNTASRMESHGEAGKIHVSEEFKHAVETQNFASLQFIERGEMEIKGKGMMKTYFLEQAK
ncbi:MAG: tetratricopeptide repeat protein [Ignavibacteria bacterium]|nr:tetratricopeptide repeat protein [Ignavibacteria bacterium]